MGSSQIPGMCTCRTTRNRPSSCLTSMVPDRAELRVLAQAHMDIGQDWCSGTSTRHDHTHTHTHTRAHTRTRTRTRTRTTTLAVLYSARCLRADPPRDSPPTSLADTHNWRAWLNTGCAEGNTRKITRSPMCNLLVSHLFRAFIVHAVLRNPPLGTRYEASLAPIPRRVACHSSNASSSTVG